MQRHKKLPQQFVKQFINDKIASNAETINQTETLDFCNLVMFLVWLMKMN